MVAGGVGHHHLDKLAQQRGRRVAKHLAGRAISRYHDTGLVADDDADGSIHKYGFEAANAVGQRAFSSLGGALLGYAYQ